jgi:hypothetical protein
MATCIALERTANDLIQNVFLAWIAASSNLLEARDYERLRTLDARAPSDQISFMCAKELALEVIKRLPEDATMHDLTGELYAAAVRQGLDELDRGDGIAHDEVKRQFESWFTKESGPRAPSTI